MVVMLSNSMTVKVRSHPSTTTEDLIHSLKPIACRKTKMLIIHTGTNDLLDDMNTIKKLKKVIHEIDVKQEIKVAFSGFAIPEDNNFVEKMKDRNTKLESYCKSKGFVFINNSKLNSSSLNRRQLPLNPKGTDLLYKNFANCVKAF